MDPKEVKHNLSKLEGVASREADLIMARKVLGWKPKVGYREGFEKTINWYINSKIKGYVKTNLIRLLLER